MPEMDPRLPSASPALRFDHVSFAYRREPVVRDVSLRVTGGEMLGLIGPNGAGKSTLLKLASGTLKPDAGTIALHGVDMGRLSRVEVARQVAVVPQDFSVQFAYTVRQIVELGRTPHMGAWGIARPEDRAAVNRALAATGIAPLAERVFNELSGGERQRVVLALALAQSAGIVLLDEPTAHLDIKHQIEMLELLRALNRDHGLTVVAVLHDLNLAARYFARLVLMRQSVVTDGPPASVLDANLLTRLYETPVQVGILRGEEHISVLPPGHAGHVSPSGAPAAEAAPAAHVLAGGGSGELLMRALADASLTFTAGPLNAGDSDHALARRLAALCLTEPPYAAVSTQALAAARERIRAAGVVVVCPMPLGPGNVVLLEEALAAAQAGARVILLEPEATPAGAPGAGESITDVVAAAVAARDFSGRGPELYSTLVHAGACLAASPSHVVALLSARSAY